VHRDSPRLPNDACALVYAELAFDDEGDLDATYEALREVLALVRLDPEQSWAGLTERDMAEMKRLRHAVPESVNAIIGQRKRKVPELHKVGTDMAVPDESLSAMMAFYRRRLGESGLDSVVFGHIGNGHVHVNILPRTLEDMTRAGGLYVEFAREAVRLGGRVIVMSFRPGRIKSQFTITLPRPRNLEDPQLTLMAREVLAQLKEEINKAVEEEFRHEENP